MTFKEQTKTLNLRLNDNNFMDCLRRRLPEVCFLRCRLISIDDVPIAIHSAVVLSSRPRCL